MELKEKSPNYIFKICLVGDGGVGKTCIARRLCYNTFSLNTQLTVGIDFYTYDMPIIVDGEEGLARLLIWDFGGQEHFKTLFGYYISGANGIFLVFDLLRLESLMKLDWWYDKLIEYNLENCPKVLIGTKLDLAEIEDKQFSVDRLIIEQFLQKHNEKDYISTSSKENTNIIKCFKGLAKKVLDLNNLNYDKIL
ncbi:MAG: Rab family GTPase [Promethearchaeota archaeon]